MTLVTRTYAIALALAVALLAPALHAQDKPLVAGVDGTFAPHAMPKLGGGIEGFNIDLVEEIARAWAARSMIDAGAVLRPHPGDEGRHLRLPRRPDDRHDRSAPTTCCSPRAISTPTSSSSCRKRPDAAITELDELEGKVISVNKGSAYDTWAQENAAKYRLQGASPSAPTPTPCRR